MLAPGGEVGHDSPLAALAIESLAAYPGFVRELEGGEGQAIDFQRCGAIDLAYSDEEKQSLETRAEAQIRLGIRSRSVSFDEIRTFWPRIRTDGLVGGRFYPDDAIVNPREVVQALLGAAGQHNVQVRSGCAVQRISVSGDQVEMQTEASTGSFDAAVIAAGAWSGSIPVAGVPTLPSTKPVKGHLIGYNQPDLTCNTIIRYRHTYLLQRASGLLIAGASVQDVGFDRQIEPAIVDDLACQASFILPHLAETTISESWIGFRPGADALHLGTWHSPRLHLAYGHYRNGILLAPVTADRTATAVIASLEKRQAAPSAHQR
jgi:glycine oxidase